MSGNKLWSKENTSTSALIETFTVGRDKEFDVLLAEYDVLGFAGAYGDAGFRRTAE